MTIFDRYRDYAGKTTISPTLLWEYNIKDPDWDWWRSRKIVVQRVIERGWLPDFYAAINMYGGIEAFKNIIKEVPVLSERDMAFVCTVFGLKKEELRCYTRKLLREKLLNS
ncbi:MAG: hypothetical protein K2H70_03810 [Bacteroidales bacterium]|nr:hypothetical protein [Bacteroidales bacterium]